jgi:hypothetical protein
LKVVRGESYVEAIWARDLNTLLDGLRRLMIPLYQRERTSALLMIISSFLLLMLPFILLPFLLFNTTLFFIYSYSVSANDFLLLIDMATIALLLSTSAIQSKYALFQNMLYALGSPLAGVIILFAFVSSILDATKKNAVNWKDRQYIIK